MVTDQLGDDPPCPPKSWKPWKSVLFRDIYIGNVEKIDGTMDGNNGNFHTITYSHWISLRAHRQETIVCAIKLQDAL